MVPKIGHAENFDVLTIGDSITAGLIRTAGGAVSGITNPQFGSVNIGGYQPYAISSFNAQSSDSITTYNWGFHGMNSATATSHITTALNSRSFDFAWVMYGANDPFQGVPPSATAANIAIIADKIIARDVIPILSTVTPNPTFAGSIVDMSNRIADVAEDKELQLAENYAVLNANWPAYDSGDLLHVGASGNSIMADEWVRVFQLALKTTVIVPLLVPLLLN